MREYYWPCRSMNCPESARGSANHLAILQSFFANMQLFSSPKLFEVELPNVILFKT